MESFGNTRSTSIGQSSVDFAGLGPASPIAKGAVPLSVADSFSWQSHPVEPDAGAHESDKPLTIKQKAGYFLKGLVSPFTEPFSSVSNFLKAGGIFAAHMLLLAATGGAAAVPMLAFAGCAAVYHTGKAIYKLSKAKNSTEQGKAIHSLGAGIGNLLLLGYGAKATLKEGTSLAPEAIDQMTLPQAVRENYRQVPESTRKSYQALRSGDVYENTKTYLGHHVNETTEKLRTTHQQVSSQWADKQLSWQLRVKNIASDFFHSLSFGSLLSGAQS